MVRSRWIKAVMATLVSTGMVWGQSAAPPTPKAPDDPTGRIITVQEAGKPAQKCKVVKWWIDEKGSKVWQVEALDTGEVLTIIAGSPPVSGETGPARSLKTTIFHWRNHTPPPGAPLAPEVACDCGTPSSGTVVAGTPCPPCSTTPLPVIETTRPVETKVTQAEPSVLQKLRESWGKSDAPKLPPADTVKAPEKKVVLDEAKKPAPLPKVENLPKADVKKPDPLLGDPTQYAKKPLDEKLPAKGELPPPQAPKTPAPLANVEPLGAGGKSITDSGTVQGRPVPVATLPPYNVRPPAPQWQVPQAPQPIVNPGRGNAPEAVQGGIAYNAFTPYELTPPAPGTAAQSAMANAFSADTDCCVAPVPHGLPAGRVYGPPGPPKMVMVAQAGPRPAGPGLPASPYGPVVQLSAPNGTGEGMPSPAATQGSALMLASYQGSAAMPAGGQTPEQLAGMLHDALYPSQREWAAERLSAYDWKQTEAAVQALTQAVREDPAATVRASCISALAKMKVNTFPVVSAIQAAKNDGDPRVRTAAEEALAVLAPGTSAPAGKVPATPPALPQTVVPVSAVSPAPLPPVTPPPAAAASSSLPSLPPLK
jgi:hypothetical protein